jgi:serine/threonine protein kinase
MLESCLFDESYRPNVSQGADPIVLVHQHIIHHGELPQLSEIQLRNILDRFIKCCAGLIHDFETESSTYKHAFYTVVFEICDDYPQYLTIIAEKRVVIAYIRRLIVVSIDQQSKINLENKNVASVSFAIARDAVQSKTGNFVEDSRVDRSSQLSVRSNFLGTSMQPSSTFTSKSVSQFDESVSIKGLLYFLLARSVLSEKIYQEVYAAFVSKFVSDPNEEVARVTSILLSLTCSIVSSNAPHECEFTVSSVESWLKPILHLHSISHVGNPIGDSIFSCYHEQLVKAIISLLQHIHENSLLADKLPEFFHEVILSLANACVKTKSSGQSTNYILLLTELNTLVSKLAFICHQDLVMAKNLVNHVSYPLFGILYSSLVDDNSRVCQISMTLLEHPLLKELVIERTEILEKVVSILYRNGTPHWNSATNIQIAKCLQGLIEKAPTAMKTISSRLSAPPVEIRSRQGIIHTAVAFKPSEYKNSPPPLEITGVAPWAASNRGVANQPRTSFKEISSGIMKQQEESVSLIQRYIEQLMPTSLHADVEGGNLVTSPLVSSPPAQLHLKFHDLVFGKTLGSGAFSIVKYAKQILRDKTASQWPECAVKIFSIEKIQEVVYFSSIVREIVILQQLNHPNIARYISSFRTETEFFLVTEFSNGGDLHDAVSNFGNLDVEIAKILMGEVVAALSSMHSLGFLYHDIKPENISLIHFRDSNGKSAVHAKLVDFGGARMIGNEYDSKKFRALRQKVLEMFDVVDSDNIEVDERFEGTKEYMAPELLNKTHPPSFASDAYAFGATLFYILSGEFPNLVDIFPDAAPTPHGKSVMFNDVKNGFPLSFDSGTCAFLTELLHPDPLQRLGSGGLHREVMMHPWFNSDVNNLYRGRGVTNEHFYSTLLSNKTNDAKPRHLSTFFAPIPRTYTMSNSNTSNGAKNYVVSKDRNELSLSELAAMPIHCIFPPLNL